MAAARARRGSLGVVADAAFGADPVEEIVGGGVLGDGEVGGLVGGWGLHFLGR